MANVINWFEIPVTNFERALNFYKEILDGEIEVHDMGPDKYGFFNNGGEGVSGAIVKGESFKPAGSNGVKIYLNGGDDLAPKLAKVLAAGGTITMPKTLITDEIGFMAFFKDTEGNELAFHSQN